VAQFLPFADEQCRECVALPVCLGGCPFFHFEHPLREAQCGTFRFNHQARVARAARLALGATRRRLVKVAG
jgi:sulfatase maturation enzyme AslB (radical SAM superfamily)